MVTLNTYAGRANNTHMELVGLSTDVKPVKHIEGIGIANGSSFVEMDTSKIYLYDAANETWLDLGGDN